jgi:hypothetical protein
MYLVTYVGHGPLSCAQMVRATLRVVHGIAPDRQSGYLVLDKEAKQQVDALQPGHIFCGSVRLSPSASVNVPDLESATMTADWSSW